jgi:1-acyl-sn-glycerol-3-phosphate acyltransferase
LYRLKIYNSIFICVNYSKVLICLKFQPPYMKNFLSLLYTTWCTFWVFIIFFSLFPIMAIIVQKEKWRYNYIRINKLWCKSFFLFAGIRNEVEFQYQTDFNKPYIYCSNHFSSFDNFTLHLYCTNKLAVIGDYKIGQLPLFGYLFKKMNICINRSNQGSKNRQCTIDRKRCERKY